MNEQDLRYRVLRILQIVTIVATILAAISNIVNRRPADVIMQPVIATLFIVFIFLFQKGSRKKRYISKMIFLTFFNVVYLPIAWYYSPGVSSAIGYYAILTIVMSVFFVEHPIEFILPVSGIAISVFMIRYELIAPEHFEPFRSKATQINDVTFNFLAVVILLFIVVTYINRNYVIEKNRFYMLSITDDLTGVYNRRYLLETLDEMVRKHAEESPVSLLFLDLNNFKEINDTYGHHEGDRVLMDLGRVLKNEFKYCGRFGGDEFLVIIPDATLDMSQKKADRLKDLVDEYAKVKGYGNLSLSVGVISSTNKNAEEIIREADSYMYKAKHKIKGT